MRFDLASKTVKDRWALDILEGLRDVLAPHEDVLEQAIARFSADYARVIALDDLLTGVDTVRYGGETARLFTEWDETDGGPGLAALQAFAFEHFNLPRDGAPARAAMAAAVLAEVPNDLLYHGNAHYRKVMFHTIRLMATQICGNFPYQPLLYSDDLIKLLISTAIHDLGHEGGDNQRNGIYTPGYMEQKAFDHARDYFDNLDLDHDFARDIEAMVFCTDITFIAGDNSPCVRMKKIYRHFFLGGMPEGEDIENMLIGKLRRFEDNPRLSIMAMLLHEADIATSAGLTYAVSKMETRKIMQEYELDIAGPKVFLKFMSEQLGGSMVTPAAQQVFGAQMEDIMRQAFADQAAGVEKF
ncbi:MAG: hypothetical protein JWO78_1934 [Micavibrio sp.]|nr:hypothetical protein [Micavibrio sp.]